MISWMDSLAQSVHALGNHRLRTALSILGITIGITAVMAVSTISKGGNHIVYSELETFGLNSIWLYRNWNNDSPLQAPRRGSGIDNEDLAAIEQTASSLGIKQITPVVRPGRFNWLVRHQNNFANADILGVNPAYADIVNDSLLSGRNINHIDILNGHPIALLAPNVARKLFPKIQSPIGEEFRIDTRRYVVAGLLAGKSRDFLSSIGSAGGRSANDRIIVPFTALQRLKGDRDISNLHMEAAISSDATNIAERVSLLLQRRHQNNYQYSYETMASNIETSDRILGGVGLIGVIAASISLLVGGMGIMNMMGTSVLERTREIGIRKAIGATERDIMNQFLIEAAIISLIGGILGLFIGGLATAVLARLTGFPLLPSVVGIGGALLVSIAVGVLSGYLPARRAAKLHPVESLRAE